MVIIQQPERDINQFEFALHLCVFSPAAGGFTSAEITVRKQLKMLLLLKVPGMSVYPLPLIRVTTGGSKRQKAGRCRQKTERTWTRWRHVWCWCCWHLFPVRVRRCFTYFILKKKVEMCLYVLKVNCVVVVFFVFFCISSL